MVEAHLPKCLVGIAEDYQWERKEKVKERFQPALSTIARLRNITNDTRPLDQAMLDTMFLCTLKGDGTNPNNATYYVNYLLILAGEPSARLQSAADRVDGRYAQFGPIILP